MGEHVTRTFSAAAPRGSTDAIEQLREVAADPGDAPVATYLREAFKDEVVSSLLHGIHRTLASSFDAPEPQRPEPPHLELRVHAELDEDARDV